MNRCEDHHSACGEFEDVELSNAVPTPSDWELIERIAERDAAAFEMLYDRYSATLFGICMRVLRREAEARDVLSEVFLEVWEKASKYECRQNTMRAFLVTLTRCRSIDRLRSMASKEFSHSRLSELWHSVSSRQPMTVAPQEQMERDEEISFLRDAMCNLSDLQRDALNLAYFEGMTHLEISQSLQIPLGTAKSAIRRGIAILRDHVSGIRKEEVG